MPPKKNPLTEKAAEPKDTRRKGANEIHRVPRKRRKVMLALGWYDYQVNLGVAAYAQRANWILNDVAGHTHHIPLHWQSDGILLSLAREITPSLRQLLDLGLPVIDLRTENSLDLPRVIVDNHAVGRMAAEHLLSRGFQHLGYYQAYVARVETERMEGFREVVEEAGREFLHIDLSNLPCGQEQGEARQEALAARVASLPTPIGVMAQYDGSAAEFALACEYAERMVPEQVAIVGVDNDPITSELGLVPLTSVDTDRFRHGFEAAKLLDQLMNGEPAPTAPILIPPKGLVIRRSSNIIAVPNTAAASALRFIMEHFREPIRVEDIVQAGGAPRRTLFQAFKTHLGRTVMEEVHRLRIAEASRLLVETDEKTYSIALDTGYNDARHLNKNFQRIMGTTPSEYRASNHHC